MTLLASLRASVIAQKLQDHRQHKEPFMCELTPEVRARFERDVVEWQQATGHLSTTLDMSMHFAYQRIIGLGPVAVPLIIEQLRSDGDHWFWALVAIVGEDKAIGAKTVPEATQCWVEWYDQNSSSYA